MLLIKNRKIRQLFGVLETMNFLGLKLWLKNPSDARLFPGEVFRVYMNLVQADRWTSKSVFAAIPELTSKLGRVVIEYLPGEGVATPPDALLYLALVTQAVAPKLIFEIGTYRGRTALNFALNSPHDCRVLTLDLPPAIEPAARMNVADASLVRTRNVGADYRGKDVSYKIEQLYGDSLKFDFDPYAGQVDLVFVDGAHHYAAVRSDTKNALRMVRRGGVILWDDFANYGEYNDVTRAILDSLPASEIVQIASTQLAFYRNRSE